MAQQQGRPLPKDPVILLSFINTKLRDDFASLDELSSFFGADKEQIITTLGAIGYEYDPERNSFR